MLFVNPIEVPHEHIKGTMYNPNIGGSVARSRQVHILIMEALLIAIYLEEKDAYMHIRPTLMPEAALPPEATLPPGAYPAEPVRTSVARPTSEECLMFS
jgi:hypothetical protein